MILVEQLPASEALKPLNLNDQRKGDLERHISTEVNNALSARNPLDFAWIDSMRLYEARPLKESRNIPIENAPNFEVPVVAIVTDTLYAQAVDAIFGASPTLTVRAGKNFIDEGKSLQSFITKIESRIGVKEAAEHALLDDVQLGTAVYYVPWVESVKKTDIHRTMDRGPKIFSWPIEDLVVPGGATQDIQLLPWVGLRWWMTRPELEIRKKRSNWDIEGVQTAGATSLVRSRRELLSLTSNQKAATADLFEIINLYMLHDIDDDGIDEDLQIFWDRTSQKIVHISYNNYDHRPIEVMRYQIRAHMFYGMGVGEMMRNLQPAISDTMNYWMLNMFLANCRFFKARTGTVSGGTMRLWPNKIVEVNDPEDLKPEAMADAYNSGPVAVQMLFGFTERRTGLDTSGPQPSQILRSRTPATTAGLAFQQVNKRFAPAFDQMRSATAGAVRQCLYRYQERLLAGDTTTEEWILDVMGDKDGERVISLLKDKRFDDEVSVVLTATSATVNRDSDKQNTILLVNILIQYYQRVLELTTVAANQQIPEEVRNVATQIVKKAGEIMDRVIRTFDSITDPETFIIEQEERLNNELGGLPQEGLDGLSRLIGLAGGGENGGIEPDISKLAPR